MSCPKGYHEVIGTTILGNRTITCVADADNLDLEIAINEARAQAAERAFKKASEAFKTEARRVKDETSTVVSSALQYAPKNPRIPQVILLGTALVLIVFSLTSLKG